MAAMYDQSKVQSASIQMKRGLWVHTVLVESCIQILSKELVDFIDIGLELLNLAGDDLGLLTS